MLDLRGLVPAAFTPMRADGSLRLEQVPPLVDRLLAEGAAAIYAVGSTGEGVSLTGAERRAVAEAFVEAAAGRLPVLVQVGHTSVRESRELAAHAGAAGAAAISTVAPFYFRPDSPGALIDCLEEVAAGAPELPLYYYHIPQLTGVELELVSFLAEARERLPTLAGVKYTSTAVHELQACLAEHGRELELLYGVDEMLLAGLCAGARAAVGSTYNFAAPLYRGLLDAFARGDLETARRAQARSVALVRTVVRHGGNAALKAVMKLVGLDCGPARVPLARIGPETLEELRAELEALGFFDWGRTEGGADP